MASLHSATFCSVGAAPSCAAQPCADKQAVTGAVFPPAGISNEISSSGEVSVPLPIEVVIPKERLPDVLDVYDNGALLSTVFDQPGAAECRSCKKFLTSNPIKFVRKYPVRIPTTPKGEEVVGDMSNASAILDRHITGQLDINKHLDSGGHSLVFLAAFTLPSCAAASVPGGVAVKMATPYSRDREMLENEAEIYDKFPCELQESTPSSPPIVPKFFGYYIPSSDWVDGYKGDDEDEEGTRKVRKAFCKVLQYFITPILLLEHCGEPINTGKRFAINRDTILGVFDRLHNSRFVQNSVQTRNILVQPGPLTHPRAERSFDNPSYRVIDFGRGKCYNGDENESADKDMQYERWKVQLVCDGTY